MASLTHVCMWSDNGWKRITAEQASRLHPGGTVSAHSGLFMCELCGQYVGLSNGKIYTRYFYHNSAEKSKDCPERTFGAGYLISYGSQEHDLPIRITVSRSLEVIKEMLESTSNLFEMALKCCSYVLSVLSLTPRAAAEAR